MESPFLTFPTELRGGGISRYPYVRFICEETSGESQSLSAIDESIRSKSRSYGGGTSEVILPVPPGLSISDGASYQDINLGILGDLTKTSQESISGNKGFLATTKGDISNMWNKFVSGQNAASIAAQAAGLASEVQKEAINLGARQILNPNKVVTFGGTQIRGFGFSFKMVARDKADAVAMKTITSFFRKYMYPDDLEEKGVIMKYPSLWSIKFMDKGRENKYMPKIYPSYLTSLQATFNSSTNIHFEDGSPVECDVSMQFQEAKALTRRDLRNMGDFNSANT